MQPYSFMHHKNISRTYLRHFVCCLSLLTATSSFAQTGPTPATDFTTYSIEELMNIELVSAAKKPQTTSESAAAVFVITQEDIRRSGAVNLPEVLRMAPGIQVLRSEPGDFAVTSRGFLGEFANKLLVLIDGRSIYSPLFSGTFWEYNDMLLEDIVPRCGAQTPSTASSILLQKKLRTHRPAWLLPRSAIPRAMTGCGTESR
jgi:iron complex outermembrane receptor protein